MKITVDTNVLLRLLVPDNKRQQQRAIEILKAAELVAISVHTVCELVWVMERSYGSSRRDIAAAIRAFMNTSNVVMNRPVIEAGLRLLENGGDFADGVIAYDGQWLGGDTFVSFDKKAVRLLIAQGGAAHLLQ